MAHSGSASLLIASAIALLAGGCDALSAPTTRGASDPPSVFPPGPIPSGEPAPGCKVCNATADCFDCGSGCQCMNVAPAPEPWLVPFAARGDDGWRSSQRPLCASLQDIDDHSIWADRRGVFAAVSGVSAGLALDDVPDDDAGVVEDHGIAGDSSTRTRVFHNEGSGWSLRADLAGWKASGLAAASAAKLIVYGKQGVMGDACLLGVLSGDRLECEGSLPVRHAYAVSETRAFALVGDRSVLEHDGQAWVTRAQPSIGAHAIWADDDEVIVVGDAGLQRLIDGAWVSEKVGSEAALTAVWGRNGDDLWVGDAEGRLLHFDGAGWQMVGQLGGVTCARQAEIVRIAGADADAGAHIWVHTSTQLARWNGSELESFGNWTCAPLSSGDRFDSLRIEDLSVVDEDDVFIAFAGGAVASCGAAYVVHFDGKAFHRF